MSVSFAGFFFYYFRYYFCRFQLLDKPWSQVSFLPPPRYVASFLSHRGVSASTARRVSSNFASPSSRVFSESVFAVEKKLRTRGSSNSKVDLSSYEVYLLLTHHRGRRVGLEFGLELGLRRNGVCIIFWWFRVFQQAMESQQSTVQYTPQTKTYRSIKTRLGFFWRHVTTIFSFFRPAVLTD